MTTYRVKATHDQALVDLVALAPQPASTGVQATSRTFAASGAVYNEAAFVELQWGVLSDETAYLSILTAFGLHNALTAPVTVYVRNHLWQWARYNGLAVQPLMGSDIRHRNYFLGDLTVLVRDLELLA